MYFIFQFIKPIKVVLVQFAIVVLMCGIAFSGNRDSTGLNKHPVYPPSDINMEALIESVQPIMEMSKREVIAQVPNESGIYFIGCPNCHGGAQESGVLGWKPGMGSTVRCNYCEMLFPNEEFPNNREKVISTPSGAKQFYRYYEDSNGYPYYFEAHAWYERWLWIRPMAEKLSWLWYVTKDNAYGDRAAAITGRFAQVFPDYAVRFDFPSKPVVFFPADQKWPYEGLNPYRGAKWRWWGYGDTPTHLANVYDVLESGYDWTRMDELIGIDTKGRIVRDLLRLGYEFATSNPETYTNMSPVLYRSMIRLGRILEDVQYVEEAIKRFKEFVQSGMFADGWWKEGTPSYHSQTVNLMNTVFGSLEGYERPLEKNDGYKGLDLKNEYALYHKALRVLDEAVLPNGRPLPINDTWPYSAQIRKTDTTASRLWFALGNAAVGGGKGESQVMLNVNWSGNHGHAHYDNGSIILYAKNNEMLSDIGYTHTNYRGWTIHTASHNTVVIDQKSQRYGTQEEPATGRLNFYDDKDKKVKVIDVDASPAYSDADEYRRRLILVRTRLGYDYVIDRFDVKGGEIHDWFLHGMCEEEGDLEVTIPLDQYDGSIVPEWAGDDKPKSQYDTDENRFHPYSYLKDIEMGKSMENWGAIWYYKNSGLKTHIISDRETEVYRFVSPSIRMAEEDNAILDDYMRRGLMLRQSKGVSTFLAVHEPFGDKPWIESVKYINGVIFVRYRAAGRDIEDRITMDGEELSVISTDGWQYKSGKPISGKINSLNRKKDKWYIEVDKEVPGINYIRINFPNGNNYYCAVDFIEQNRIFLLDPPGFTLDSQGTIDFYTFPHDQFEGGLTYTLFD